jgi:hypothetical protein
MNKELPAKQAQFNQKVVPRKQVKMEQLYSVTTVVVVVVVVVIFVIVITAAYLKTNKSI